MPWETGEFGMRPERARENANTCSSRAPSGRTRLVGANPGHRFAQPWASFCRPFGPNVNPRNGDVPVPPFFRLTKSRDLVISELTEISEI